MRTISNKNVIKRLSIQGLKNKRSELEFEILSLERAYNIFPATSKLGRLYLKGALKKYKKDLAEILEEIESRKRNG